MTLPECRQCDSCKRGEVLTGAYFCYKATPKKFLSLGAPPINTLERRKNPPNWCPIILEMVMARLKGEEYEIQSN